MTFIIENIDLIKLCQTGTNKLLKLPEVVIDFFMMRLECILSAYDYSDIENDIALNPVKKRGRNQILLRIIDNWKIDAELIINKESNKIESIFIKNIIQIK